MTAAQAHRGPDASGLHAATHAVLGHRRLSILDLSPAGHQPMSNEDGTIWVTYNGEIYNQRELRRELVRAGHDFGSTTDTEVLVHGYEQWGIEGLLARLRGMFAFGLYDPRRGLLLARDRLGIKPLYYFDAGDTVLFASEVKALLRSGLVPEERDRKALAGFLIVGAVPSPLTIVKGVRCLPPGHWVDCSRHGVPLTIHKYWDLDCDAANQDEDTYGIRACLEDAVRRHFLSDVPVGVFLSGGVDSAGLVAVASRVLHPDAAALVTLTVTFDERAYSESAPARRIADHFHTCHREIRVTAADFQKQFHAFLGAMDQPTNDGINTYFISQAARQAGLTVVLSGLGGDEVFWGYRHYRWLAHTGMLAAIPAPLRRLVARGGYQWGRLLGRDRWMRTDYLRGDASNEQLYLAMRGFFAPSQAARLLGIGRAEMDATIEEQFGDPLAERQPAQRGVNYIEVKRYLHDQLLRDTDVFSMAHSIEARVPYLDHVLVERLWRVAPSLKLHHAVNKPLLVRAVDDPLLLQAGSRPKNGFVFPMARWMRTCAPELREIADSGALDRGAVRQCWNDFSAGRLHWSRAWSLAVLGASN
jgi:asparagine synthase (glutamine-hydrolysing)